MLSYDPTFPAVDFSFKGPERDYASIYCASFELSRRKRKTR